MTHAMASMCVCALLHAATHVQAAGFEPAVWQLAVGGRVAVWPGGDVSSQEAVLALLLSSLQTCVRACGSALQLLRGSGE